MSEIAVFNAERVIFRSLKGENPQMLPQQASLNGLEKF